VSALPFDERVKRVVDTWVVKLSGQRRPEREAVKLTQRLVYILPSRMGLAFVLVLALMLLAAINYKLALGYALTFLLVAIAWVGLFHTWRNLLGIVLRSGRGESVFAGELVEISLTIANPSKLERFAVRMDTPTMAQVVNVDLTPNAEQVVRLALNTQTRGWLDCPRFRLSTYFPLGLWRAWAYWHPAVRVLVYPAPEVDGPALPNAFDDQGDGPSGGPGMDDVSSLRPYVDGDSPRRIDWKAMARTGGQQLLTKQFEGGARGELALTYADLPLHFTAEQRLSRLTHWVLEAERIGMRYSLNLPGQEIASNHGSAHKHACLSALGMFELAPNGRPERRKATPIKGEAKS
jgi:uncharacterized protein (DUF58 family)